MTDVSRYTTFRIALLSGILGATGATLGWLAWLTTRVADLELLYTVMLGAALGVIVHWIRHYIMVARREHHGQPGGHAHAPPALTKHSNVALAWAAGFAFLGLVTEHLVAHMAAEFLKPFLASLAALLPAGMILGATMNHGRYKDEHVYLVLFFGLLVGGAITLVTGLIWTIGFGTAPWLPLISWWGLIGIGSRIVVRSDRHSVRIFDPIIAVVLVFVGTFLLNLLPSDQKAYDWFGPYRGVPFSLHMMAVETNASPALPATFWIEAEKRFTAREHQKECLARRPVGATVTDPPPPPIDTIAHPLPKDPLRHAIASMALPSPPDTQSTYVKPPKELGATAEFFRSWLVILLFAVGIGVAPWLERTLRPADYPNSETYRKDITLTVVVLLLLIGACWFARRDQGHEVAQVDACQEVPGA